MNTDINNSYPETLKEAIEYFSDKDRCFTFMLNLRWKNGIAQCPICKSENTSFISTRYMWKCKNCKKQFTIKVGTIMEDSPLGYDIWLSAIWLIANAKNGISSMEIHRSLGVTRKTAWFLLHRIRLAMQTGTFEKMNGTVEADETYIGGKAANMHKSKKEEKIHGRGASGKAIIMGILNRGEKDKENKNRVIRHSKVHAEVIVSTDAETLHEKIRNNVEAGSTLLTDELKSYIGMEEYVHEAVNHAERYVFGNVHTNGMENFWTLLKRCIKGTYIAIEPEHLFRYVGEEVFRFNERGRSDYERFAEVVGNAKDKRITYKQLINS